MANTKFNPIAWTEGMFLRPQHMQHQDQFSQERLNDQLRSLNPFHWGIRELEIDEEALSDHRVEVVRLDALLPDGSLLKYPGGALMESREFDPSVQGLDVWIGIRRVQPGEANSAPPDSTVREVRYKLRSEEASDLHRGGEKAPIEVLVPNVRMFVTGEELELESHESIKIARIEATGELKRPFALSTRYAPPLLAIQAHAPLEEEIAKILSQLAAKIRVVAGRTATIAVADLPRMWMRYTLARMTPVLRHLMSTGATSPFPLYTALIETAGALATFETGDPVELPSYRHDDPYPCFHQLLEFIDVHLEGTLPSRYKEIKLGFDPAAGKKFYTTTELNMQLVDPRNFFFLGIKAPIDSKELLEVVKESGKAASAREIPTLLMMNLEGLRIEPLPASPTDIAAPIGFEWFRIEPHSNERIWKAVREDFSLGVSLGKLENADVRLYVVEVEA